MGKIVVETKEGKLKSCASDMDGECYHKDCPQIRDNEPNETGRHCPLDELTWRE